MQAQSSDPKYMSKPRKRTRAHLRCSTFVPSNHGILPIIPMTSKFKGKGFVVVVLTKNTGDPLRNHQPLIIMPCFPAPTVCGRIGQRKRTRLGFRRLYSLNQTTVSLYISGHFFTSDIRVQLVCSVKLAEQHKDSRDFWERKG